jgi:hypothetical protein
LRRPYIYLTSDDHVDTTLKRKIRLDNWLQRDEFG